MTELNEKELTNFIRDVLISSGNIAIKYFRGGDNEVSLKNDGSIVTIADKEIEEFIRKKIEGEFPNHSIYGEEFGGIENLENEFCWVIDPIDGTSSFSAGRPIFGIMIGLVNNGKPVIGAVYQPITKELWLGINGKTTLNNQLIQAREPDEKNLTIATTSPDLLDEEGKKHWDFLKHKAKNVIYGGDCYNYCLLASGKIDIVFEQGLKPYDFIPLIPILEGSNAKIFNKNKKIISNITEILNHLEVKV